MADPCQTYGQTSASVLVISGPDTDPADLRLGALAGGFARAGMESFVAIDMIRPPPDGDRAIIRGRWRLADAVRLRQNSRMREASEAADYAIQLFELNALTREHLQLLVQAYAERGAIALASEDPITAETMFLRAVALEPRYQLPADRYGRKVRKSFTEVRRASRLIRYGTVRIEVPALPSAKVSIDFGSARPAPYETKLPDGRHFVSVQVPGRPEVTALIPIRAERRVSVLVRPPVVGDKHDRKQAYDRLDVDRPESVVALAKAAGTRFVAQATAQRGVIQLLLIDGVSGEPVTDGSATLSQTPSSLEVDAAVQAMIPAARSAAPNLDIGSQQPAWYSTWWGITLIGVAVAAATTTTVFALSNDQTEYRFEP
ncbi:MAG: hypothetical protein AAF449_10305 [Myxococcota bacterium]